MGTPILDRVDSVPAIPIDFDLLVLLVYRL